MAKRTRCAIVTENVRRTRNTIKGSFRLCDGTTTKFEISREYGFNQWGNSTENLYKTVPRLEQLQQELFDQ
jgi:hypothetical protein